MQRDEALALLAVLGQPVRVEVQRDVSHHRPTSFRQPSLSPSTLLVNGGEGQVEWESAAVEDPISDKLTKRSRRPQIGSVVLVRMSEEGE